MEHRHSPAEYCAIAGARPTPKGSASSFSLSPAGVRILCRALSLTCVLTVAAASQNALADDALEQNQGYILARITAPTDAAASTNSKDFVAFTNIETEENVNVRIVTPRRVGRDSWVTLVPVPEGYYFFREYAPFRFSLNGSLARRVSPVLKGDVRTSDLFEVRSGVINYIGDWVIDVDFNSTTTQQVECEYNLDTVDYLTREFENQSAAYDVVVSAMGKRATTLDNFTAIVN